VIYAVGDIHGQLQQLQNALALIETDGGTEAEIVFLGDFVDHGPNARGVIDTLVQGQKQERRWICLRGNHDRMFARFLQDGQQHDNRISSGIGWLNPAVGGLTTLASYGVDGLAPDVLAKAQNAVPESHQKFLQNLPLWHPHEELIFVHAGIRPQVAIAQQSEDDLLWIRDEFLDFKASHGPLIVHGHTALRHPMHCGNRINLDGGAKTGNPLIPAVFEGNDCWLLSEKGRVPLRPEK